MASVSDENKAIKTEIEVDFIFFLQFLIKL